MRSARLRNALLSSIALVALAAYIIACRPSFSPDGAKLLVPVLFDKTISVALHDLRTGKTRWLCEKLPRGDEAAAAAQWLPDGKQAVVIWLAGDEQEKERMRAMVLSVAGEKPSRVWSLAADKNGAVALAIPPPVLGRHLFVGGELLQRLDLGSGETKTAPIDGEIYLVRHGTTLRYISWRDAEGEKVYEIGTLDAASLERKPTLALRPRDHGEIAAFFAISRDGSRLALLSAAKEAYKILIFLGEELEKTIPLGKKAEQRRLGNLEWTPDGKTLHVAFARAGRLGVLEVSVATGGLREIPFFESREGADEAALFFQIALSPDGKTLAASSGFFPPDKVAPADRALWLLDVSGEERKVRRVAFPDK